MRAVLLLSLLVASCLAAPLREKPRYIFGHGGNARDFPTNTIPAFLSTIDLGGDINEMDVHPTEDGHIVVIHDSTVDRTTNGTGYVANMTLADIKSLDAGYWFTNDGGETYPFRGTGITVPTLEELFEAVPGGLFNIDIKQHTERAARLVAETILRAGGESRCIVGSFNDETTEIFKEYAPGVTTLSSTREVVEYTLKYYQGEGDTHVPRSLWMEIPTGFVRDWVRSAQPTRTRTNFDVLARVH